MKKIGILGVSVDILNRMDLEEIISRAQVRTIFYANANTVNIAQRDRELLDILNSADIVWPDGYSIVWAAKFLNYPIKERLPVADFFFKLCEKLSEKKFKIFLLGGKDTIAEKAKIKLKQNIPLLEIAGVHGGYFKKEEEIEVIDKINNSHADILLVGMGTPKQEKWIYYNRNRLNVPLCWAVGALFDFVSGKSKRAPNWMLDAHLEWLYRLCKEPKRLWRRYILGNPLFVYRILRFKLLSKKR